MSIASNPQADRHLRSTTQQEIYVFFQIILDTYFVYFFGAVLGEKSLSWIILYSQKHSWNEIYFNIRLSFKSNFQTT